MSLRKSLLILSLPLLFACKTGHNKIVWIHFDEDLDMLHGDIKQVTIRYNDTSGKNFYNVADIDREGNERGSDLNFDGIQIKTRYVAKRNNNTDTDDFIGYSQDISDKKYQVSADETEVGIYKYDNQGRIIKYINIGGMNSRMRYIFKYNTFGDLIECDAYGNKTLDSKKTFKYDKNHLITESIWTLGTDSLTEKISYQYKKFDPMNNWLTKIIKSENGTSTTETRKIIYY